jgi:septal ring factor EnvC (AmiA/AmiB activator)
MRGKATYSTTWIATAVRSVFTPARSALAYCCAPHLLTDDRDQLKSIQADIAAKQRAIKQQQQQRALLAQLKAQEEAISAAARKLRETQET